MSSTASPSTTTQSGRGVGAAPRADRRTAAAKLKRPNAGRAMKNSTGARSRMRPLRTTPSSRSQPPLMKAGLSQKKR
eukprot:15176958-Heterocapsa_arctica.AAC.1